MVSRERCIGLVCVPTRHTTALVLHRWPQRLVRCLDRDADGVSEKGIEVFDPEHLAGKDRAEVAGDGFRYGIQLEWLAEFLLHRRHGLRRYAAGDDQVEVTEIGIYVEGKTVGSHETGDVYADGRYLGFVSVAILGDCPKMIIAAGGIGPYAR